MINLIVACAENRVIGRQGTMPWSIPEDTAFFQRQTLGHIVIMGTRSYAEWPSAGRGRSVVVVTQDPRFAVTAGPGDTGVKVASSLPAALELAQTLAAARNGPGGREIYLCGGQRIYEEGLPLADRLYLTLVHTEIADGTTFFPDWRHRFTRVLNARPSADRDWRYTFFELEPELVLAGSAKR